MLNSKRLQNLESSEFSVMYAESYISSHVEQIICLVLEKSFIERSKILSFDLTTISSVHHRVLLEKLKMRLKVSSIYINHNKLIIDWSI